MTFVPCFLFILLGAPYVERLRGNHILSAALTGITLFATTRTITASPLHLQLPDLGTLWPVMLAIAVIAAGLAFALKWPVPRILGVSAPLGLVAELSGLPVI